MAQNLSSILTSDTAPAVYIHIPFCVSKCAYCDFYSLPCGRGRDASAEAGTIVTKERDKGTQVPHGDMLLLQKRYVSALCRQMELAGKRYERPKVSTVFIGGGTPSILNIEEMCRITETLYRCFDVPTDAEFTLEANPDTLTPEKLYAYRKMGINRLSIGMQSAIDSELRTLSRIHTAESVKKAVRNAREAGFDNVNLDIMYALPSQTSESFTATLDTVVSLSPEHVSVYGLQLEEGTELFEKRESLSFPGEDGENEMNALALDILTQNGYGRYEISNYARAGYECKHNLTYWTLNEYFGFGTAAHSFKDGKRYSIKEDVYAFCDSTDFSDVTEAEETLTSETLTEEYVMLSLRLCEGLSVKKLRAVTDRADEYLKRAEPFIQGGFMELLGGEKNAYDTYLRFTPKGFNVSNTVLSEILYG